MANRWPFGYKFNSDFQPIHARVRKLSYILKTGFEISPGNFEDIAKMVACEDA